MKRIVGNTQVIFSCCLAAILSGCGFLGGSSKMVSENKSLEIQLPSPSFKGTVSIEQAIKNRRSIRQYKDTPLTLAHIGQLLWAAQGITHTPFRAAPSAGALYPLEIYLVAKNVTDLPAGVYHYNLQKHALEKRIDGDFSPKLCPQPCVVQAAASIIICGDYARIAKKYSAQNAPRYTHMEVGCVAENVYLQALSLGIGTVFVGAFDADGVKKVLALPAAEEPLCILPLGNVR